MAADFGDISRRVISSGSSVPPTEAWLGRSAIQLATSDAAAESAVISSCQGMAKESEGGETEEKSTTD